MNKQDILNSSRKFLYSIYKKYGDRACENLGISQEPKTETNNNITLTDDDYPSEFKRFTQSDREKAIKESGISDEDFLKQFDIIKRP